MCSRGEVELVGVVVEHHQRVEVLSAPQEAVLVVAPGYRTVSKPANRHGHPGRQPRLLHVTSVGQVSTGESEQSDRGQRSQSLTGDHLSSCSRRWMSCGSSIPLTDTLRAWRCIVFGSGQTNDDRKLLDEFSLTPQKKNCQH